MPGIALSASYTSFHVILTTTLSPWELLCVHFIDKDTEAQAAMISKLPFSMWHTIGSHMCPIHQSHVRSTFIFITFLNIQTVIKLR